MLLWNGHEHFSPFQHYCITLTSRLILYTVSAGLEEKGFGTRRNMFALWSCLFDVFSYKQIQVGHEFRHMLWYDLMMCLFVFV